MNKKIMRVILSRNGFDSATGGWPSIILPELDNKMISFPIPDPDDNLKYSDIQALENGKSLYDIMKDLKRTPKLTLNKEKIDFTDETCCHFDPDIYDYSVERENGWRGIFGQIDQAQTVLKNNNVEEGDLFIFFGCISLSIGLWYPIRNYIEFKQPILYIMDPHNSDLYVGNYTLWQRFLPFSNEINQMYCDPWNQYNIPIFLLKCSLFGEYSWNTNEVFENLYATSIVLNIYLIFETIYCIISQMMNKTKRNKQWKIAFLLLFIFNIFSYITMNIKLPYGCTMDFRYIASTVFTGTMFVIFEMQTIKQNKIIYNIITTLTVIMCLSADTILLLSQV